MDVRNRIASVVKLRCNACQDFLKMIIKEGWQEKIYNKAKNEVTNKTRYMNTYIAEYEKMRDKGYENYTIDDMDVSFIYTIVKFNQGLIENVDDYTLNMFSIVKEDRNGTDHSSENEEAEELYLRALLSLVDLKNLVRSIDKNVKSISDEERLAYRQKYVNEIEKMKALLDDERIELIQRDKSIIKDIDRILFSENPLNAWCEVYGLYMNRDWKLEKNPEGLFKFVVKASDAGIPYAHSYAANYFFNIKKDYVEGEKRLLMLLESPIGSEAYECKSVVDYINGYLSGGNQITDGMLELIEKVKSKGYAIIKNEEGYYEWPKKNK